jgi:dGTPase
MNPKRRPLDKTSLERMEEERLRPAAARSRRVRRPHPSLDEGRLHHHRTEFQRDRDRILHSRAFRRLKDKTQVLVPGEGDHHRTRLTHALEAAQVARTAARALELNEDLAEAVALGLNLGAPPFGPAGVRTLQQLLVADGGAGFDRAWQALRVVDLLEQRYAHPGLNLTHDVREGIAKSSGLDSIDDPQLELRHLRLGLPASPEAQLAHAADRLAALVHDIDDALRAGIVAQRRLERLGALREVTRLLGSRLAPPREGFLRANQLLRGLLHLFVVGLIDQTAAGLDQWCSKRRVDSADAFLKHRDSLSPQLVALPAATASLADELQSFVAAAVMNSAHVRRAAARAERVLRVLFRAYNDDPRTLPDHALHSFRGRARVRFLRDFPGREADAEIERHYHNRPAFHRFLADHLSGMSDRYALEEYSRLGGSSI